MRSQVRAPTKATVANPSACISDNEKPPGRHPGVSRVAFERQEEEVGCRLLRGLWG